MSDDQSGQVEHGSPFTRIFGTDSPKTLATRVYEEMCLIWDEQKVRTAFQSVLERNHEGRPARQRLEPSERWMLDAYELWSTVPGHSPDDKLGFAKYWHEKSGGQSVAAIRKQLDRLIEFADKNP